MSTKKNDSIYEQVFDYVYQQSPSNSAATDRTLSLGHFAFLAEQLGFSLDDLSLYVLAYHLGCTHTECKFDIKQHQFVEGLRSACGSSSKVVKKDGYKTAFRSLAQAVTAANEKIHSNEKELESFYVFLYNWCLRSNKADDRTTIAQELWNMFYTDDKKKLSRTAFKGYVYFPNLLEWEEFVSSPAFKTFRVSTDLWQQLRLFSTITSYEKHNPDDAWPVAIDAFVEWHDAKHAVANRPTGMAQK